MPLKLSMDELKKLTAKLKNPTLLLILGLIGMLLILVSSFLPSDKSANKADTLQKTVTAEEYRVSLEESINRLVKDITGDSKASVVVTLDSGIRYSYAELNETDTSLSTGSNTSAESSSKSHSYVTVRTADGGEQALLITEYMPEIRGVAIVCRTGSNPQTVERIKGAVTAALDISSKRVYVTGGN